MRQEFEEFIMYIICNFLQYVIVNLLYKQYVENILTNTTSICENFQSFRNFGVFFLDLELVGPGKRMLAGMVNMLFWGLGALLLTGIAYFVRDWRNLNLSLALPTILFLFYYM